MEKLTLDLTPAAFPSPFVSPHSREGQFYMPLSCFSSPRQLSIHTKFFIPCSGYNKSIWEHLKMRQKWIYYTGLFNLWLAGKGNEAWTGTDRTGVYTPKSYPSQFSFTFAIPQHLVSIYRDKKKKPKTKLVYNRIGFINEIFRIPSLGRILISNSTVLLCWRQLYF